MNHVYNIKDFFNKKKKSKYLAVRTMNVDGTWSDSKKEAKFDSFIQTHAKNVGATFQRKAVFPFVINGIKVCSYECDWLLTYPDGRKEVWDAKGFRTPVYKIKKKMLLALYSLEIKELQ